MNQRTLLELLGKLAIAEHYTAKVQTETDVYAKRWAYLDRMGKESQSAFEALGKLTERLNKWKGAVERCKASIAAHAPSVKETDPDSLGTFEVDS